MLAPELSRARLVFGIRLLVGSAVAVALVAVALAFVLDIALYPVAPGPRPSDALGALVGPVVAKALDGALDVGLGQPLVARVGGVVGGRLPIRGDGLRVGCCLSAVCLPVDRLKTGVGCLARTRGSSPKSAGNFRRGRIL